MLVMLFATLLAAYSAPETTPMESCDAVQRQALQTLGVALDLPPGRELSEGTDLTKDLELDDEDMSDVSDAFNEVFGLNLPEDQDVRTVGDLVGLVMQIRGCSTGGAT